MPIVAFSSGRTSAWASPVASSMAMWTYSQPTSRCRRPAASVRRLWLWRRPLVVIRLPSPPWMRPLFDIDGDELAGVLALVALGRFPAEPSQLAHPDPRQDARDRRERHPEQLGDLATGEPEPPERRDRLDPSLLGAVGHDPGRGRAVDQPGGAL